MLRSFRTPAATLAASLLAAALLFLPPPARAEGPPAGGDGDALLREVGERYAAVRTLSALFRQEIPLQTLGVGRKASGQLYFARPLMMRWDYGAPEEQMFLADGEYFYFRPAGSPQVIRRKVDERSLGGRIPILLLFGKGNIAEMFRVEESVPRKGGTETLLRLLPRGDGLPDIREIDLVVSTREVHVVEVHLFDRLGGENHLYLTAIQLDPAIPAELFRFRKPPEVPVVDG